LQAIHRIRVHRRAGFPNTNQELNMNKMTLAAAAAAILLTAPSLSAQESPAARGQSHTLSDLQERTQAAFARTDANGDGFITQTEAQAQPAKQTHRAKRQALREERQAKRAERLARLDTDRDGSISAAERQAHSAGVAGHEAHQQGARAERQAARAERRAAVQALRQSRTLRINEKQFARLDSDKDARLSLAEVSSRTARRFERLDSDSNGEITREERRAAREQRTARQNG
jgi:Ca2+-binding EF-hand superfamily protein